MRRLVLLLCLAAAPLWAVEPSEVLDDPALEARARALSKGLRCLVCRNENIDESNAELARELRVLVRERLVEGDSDAEVMDFLVARYGEFVLLTPTATGANLILWAAAPVGLGVASAIGLVYVRRRRRAPASEPALTQAETARLQELLDGAPGGSTAGKS